MGDRLILRWSKELKGRKRQTRDSVSMLGSWLYWAIPKRHKALSVKSFFQIFSGLFQNANCWQMLPLLNALDLFYFILAWLRVFRSLPRNGKLKAVHQKW